MLLEEIFAQLKDKKLIKYMFAALLTPKELQEIAQRIEIIQRLEKGEAHHSIAKSLGVGVATVTRGSKVFQTKGYEHIKKILCRKG